MSLFASLCAALALAAPAPTQGEPKSAALDAAARTRAINGVLHCLNENYVFPDMAKKMEVAIHQRVANREYDAITDGRALAERLTHDLQSVCNDRHLHVSYSADVLPPETTDLFTPPPGEVERMKRVLARDNYGMPHIEVLKGNIGYIECRYFAAPEMAGETYAAAMNCVANTDALILDLRGCLGSMSEDALPMLCGYFFERATHLNDLYWRATDSTRQSWTWAYVPGKRYLNKPIYLLTSGKTFSGGEELAYDLQNLKRATLVGETTGGGANGGGTRRAEDHFEVWVPNGRAINPITKTNWEGTGVTPEVKVAAIKALDTARLLALKQLLTKATEPEWKAELQTSIAEVEQSLSRYKRVMFTLKGHPDARSVTVAGSFNFWSRRANPLKRVGDAWVGEAEMEPGRQTYKFIVDGQWITDPGNAATEGQGDFINSVLIVR